MINQRTSRRTRSSLGALCVAALIATACLIGVSASPASAEPCTSACEIDLVMKPPSTANGDWTFTDEFEPGDKVHLTFWADNPAALDVVGNRFTATLPTDQIDWQTWSLSRHAEDSVIRGTVTDGTVSADFDLVNPLNRQMEITIDGVVKGNATSGSIDLNGQVTTGDTSGSQPVTDPDLTNNTASTTITILGDPPPPAGALTVSTVVDQSTALVGDLLVFDHTITNTGEVRLTDIVIDDTRSAQWANGTTVANLPAGQSTTLRSSYRVKPADLSAGTITNQATVTAQPGDLRVSGNTLEIEVLDEPLRWDVDVEMKVHRHNSYADVVFTLTNTGTMTSTAQAMVVRSHDQYQRNPRKLLGFNFNALPKDWTYDFEDDLPTWTFLISPGFDPGDSHTIVARYDYEKLDYEQGRAAFTIDFLDNYLDVHDSHTADWSVEPPEVEDTSLSFLPGYVDLTPVSLVVPKEAEPTVFLCVEVENTSDEPMRGINFWLLADAERDYTDEDEFPEECSGPPARVVPSGTASLHAPSTAPAVRPAAAGTQRARGPAALSGPRYSTLAPGATATFAIAYRPTQADRDRGHVDVQGTFVAYVGDVLRSQPFQHRVLLPTTAPPPTDGASAGDPKADELPQVGNDVGSGLPELGLVLFGLGSALVIASCRGGRHPRWRGNA